MRRQIIGGGGALINNNRRRRRPEFDGDGGVSGVAVNLFLN